MPMNSGGSGSYKREMRDIPVNISSEVLVHCARSTPWCNLEGDIISALSSLSVL